MARDWPSHERHNVSPMRLAVNNGENALEFCGTSAQPLRLAEPSASGQTVRLRTSPPQDGLQAMSQASDGTN